MKLTPPILFSAAIIGAVAMAQKSQRPSGTFRDKNGTFLISGITSHETSGSADETDFDFAGRPLSGFSKQQGLKFSMLRMVGKLKSIKGTSKIVSGTLTGDVKVAVDRRIEGEPGGSTETLASSKVIYQEQESGPLVTLPSSFTFTDASQKSGTSQTLTLKAPGGKIYLEPVGDQGGSKTSTTMPLRMAEVEGPVSVTVKKTAAGEKGSTSSIHAVGDHLKFDKTNRTLTLSGNVTVSGDQTQEGNMFYGELSGDVLTIVFDGDMLMKSYSFKGPNGRLSDHGDGG